MSNHPMPNDPAPPRVAVHEVDKLRKWLQEMERKAQALGDSYDYEDNGDRAKAAAADYHLTAARYRRLGAMCEKMRRLERVHCPECPEYEATSWSEACSEHESAPLLPAAPQPVDRGREVTDEERKHIAGRVAFVLIERHCPGLVAANRRTHPSYGRYMDDAELAVDTVLAELRSAAARAGEVMNNER